MSMLRMAMILLLAGTALAMAAPNIPPSEFPGRERERFQPSPLDRFTDPFAAPRDSTPLYQWQCDTRPRGKKKTKRSKDC